MRVSLNVISKRVLFILYSVGSLERGSFQRSEEFLLGLLDYQMEKQRVK